MTTVFCLINFFGHTNFDLKFFGPINVFDQKKYLDPVLFAKIFFTKCYDNQSLSTTTTSQ